MSTLKELLARKIEAHRPRIRRLRSAHADKKVGEVTVGQVIGGARGLRFLLSDISHLDADEGVRFRAKTIPELLAALPKVPGSDYPYVEGFWHFLLTGEVPTAEDALEVAADWRARSTVPGYVHEVLRALPPDTPPMTLLSTAVLAMQRESVFARKLREGIARDSTWEPMLEDASALLAKLPTIGAAIYRMKLGLEPVDPEPGSELDWGGSCARMMGIAPPYDDACRLHFILHSDQELGNVSAHAVHLVASGLADAYYALSAGLDGLAGPLHGSASEEVLRWLQRLVADLGGEAPTEDAVRDALWATLRRGQVIPGYGHAVLRATDPRYLALRELCLKHLPDDPLFKIVELVFRVAPEVLREHGRAKNPWPNVDAQSGVIHWHYGVRDCSFYPVLFGIGRALGTLASIVWDRALGLPIEWPSSLTTSMLEQLAEESSRGESR